MTRAIVAALCLLILPLQPSLDDQCADPTYAKLHPTICGPQSGGVGFGAGGSVESGSGGNNGLGGLPIVGPILKGLGL